MTSNTTTINSDSLRFLYWLAIWFFIGVFFVVGFIFIVDPYGLYRRSTISDFNSIKPGLSHHHNEIKITQALSLHAENLILGNSRAEIGFDPESAMVAHGGQSTYNLAIPGSGIGATRQQLQYFIDSGIRPKSLLIGVEFLDFLGPSPANLSKAGESLSKPDQRPVFSPFWQLDVLFSLAAVKDSIRTLQIQHDHEAATMTDRGFNPLNDYLAYVRNDGYYAMFEQRAQENAKMYFKKSGGSFRQVGITHLRAILDLAAESEAETKLVIYPYHAQIMVLFDESGLSPLFEMWKSLLVTEVKNAKQRHPKARIQLFDFSGFGAYNCEYIPGKHERTAQTQWYWEAGHFKKSLGDIMLKRLYAEPSDNKAPHGFGTILDESTLSTNHNRILMEQRECESRYPRLFIETRLIADMARASFPKKQRSGFKAVSAN